METGFFDLNLNEVVASDLKLRMTIWHRKFSERLKNTDLLVVLRFSKSKRFDTKRPTLSQKGAKKANPNIW
jgi:hypothetical protein